MNNSFNKTPVYLIDMVKDEDYALFLNERKTADDFVNRLKDHRFILEQSNAEQSRCRYLCITMFNHEMFWGGDSELRPLGKFTPNYVPFGGRAITIQHYLAILDAERKEDNATQPKHDRYYVQMNSAVRKILIKDKYEGWHRPYFAMRDSTHSVYTIYPFSQTYLDAAYLKDIAMPGDEFVYMYKATYEPCESMEFADYKNYLAESEKNGTIVEPKLDDSIEELYYRVIKKQPTGIVKIPKDTLRVQPKTFKKCCYISDVVFPEGLKTIGKYAFSDCRGIRRIYLPKSLAQIHYGAFHNCYRLVDVYYEGSEKEWKALCENDIAGKSKQEENGIAKLKNEELMIATVHFDCRK